MKHVGKAGMKHEEAKEASLLMYCQEISFLLSPPQIRGPSRLGLSRHWSPCRD
jgi:hypothetical protein